MYAEGNRAVAPDLEREQERFTRPGRAEELGAGNLPANVGATVEVFGEQDGACLLYTSRCV